MKRECESCVKKKTIFCPNSMECMNTIDMSYYQNRIMLLEENKKLQCYKNKFLLTKLYIIEKMREINPENLNLNDLNDKLDNKEFCYYFTYFLILQKIKEIEFEEDSKGE